MAVLLKTLNVKLDSFFQQRWRAPRSEWVNQKLRRSDKIQVAELDTFWESFLAHHDPAAQENFYQKKLEKNYLTAAPLEEDHFIWLNRWDIPLLSVSLENRPEYEKVYSNPDIAIYKFHPLKALAH